jgi:hypothetical protein
LDAEITSAASPPYALVSLKHENKPGPDSLRTGRITGNFSNSGRFFMSGFGLGI